MYPLEICILPAVTSIAGDVQVSYATSVVEGTLRVQSRGIVSVGPPRSLGYPVPEGDNGPGFNAAWNKQGILPVAQGWEYKIWDQPEKGVRWPAQNQYRGGPELARYHTEIKVAGVGAADINLYMFICPKAHEFNCEAKIKVANNGLVLQDVKFQLARPFKSGADYAITAGGPGAGLVQGLFEQQIVRAIEDYTKRNIDLPLGDKK